jgi:hypothetical protein
MSFLGLLINTVSITRPTVAYVKGRSTKTYASVATGIACRIQWVTREEIYPKVQGYEYAGEWNAFFDYNADSSFLQKDDLLIDELGREFIVQSAPIDVTGLRHHVECKLEIQEG